jgi:Flp pilus assembly protein TadG
MRARRIRDTWKNEKGQSLVEFALVVPLLLLLVIGIAEFGRAWMTQNILTGAVREAARIAVVQASGGGWNGAAAEARGNQILASAGIVTTVSVPIQATQYGDVTATVTYNFPVAIAGFIPGLSSSTFPLSSTTTMRREY